MFSSFCLGPTRICKPWMLTALRFGWKLWRPGSVLVSMFGLWLPQPYWVTVILDFELDVCTKSSKVNSVQEACAKCFAVHILKFEILQTTWKNKTKNLKSIGEKLKTKGLMFFVSFLSCDLQNLKSKLAQNALWFTY